ncbi:hypothetical protein AB1Y20_007874 [Prymnesium parvum]|uniref:tRNA/rRNA methyltransferase SpoU type domain-containing protein n=1 Tax=Prymnesium parvum TaxID=97485 RepID=A0AB34IV41_PRYPA
MASLRCVLENIENEANRASIVRSVEALGLLHVHEVRREERKGKRPRARLSTCDSEKWLRVHAHDSVGACVAQLRAEGFILCAAMAPVEASPGQGGQALDLGDLDFSRPVALVFGNERHGVSEEMRRACDSGFSIPMRGLVESLNVSVAASIALHWGRTERERILRSETDHDHSGESVQSLGDLNEEELKHLEAEYLQIATESK